MYKVKKLAIRFLPRMVALFKKFWKRKCKVCKGGGKVAEINNENADRATHYFIKWRDLFEEYRSIYLKLQQVERERQTLKILVVNQKIIISKYTYRG